MKRKKIKTLLACTAIVLVTVLLLGAAQELVTPKYMTVSREGALTAEYYLEDFYKAREAAGDALNVILGVEMRFEGSSNDYLVYGVSEEDIPRFIELVPHGIENFYKEVKSERNVIIQAHPFRKGVTLAPLDSIDGIESFNIHPGHNSRVGIGARYAKLKDLLVTGGTDFHHEGHQALCLMRSKEEMKNSYDVAEAIKSRNVILDCSGHIVIPYIY